MSCFTLLQPVYLLLRLKKGKGKQVPPFDTQSSVERRKQLTHKISINGETFDIQHDDINIHDFAQFNNTEELDPEFRYSIKSRSSGYLIRQARCESEEDDDAFTAADDESSREGAPKKARSFQDIARQVCLMENALLRWPRPNRTRHHSSSSEDNITDNEVDADTASVHTDVSEISGTENIEVCMKEASSTHVKGNPVTNMSPDTSTSIRQRTIASSGNKPVTLGDKLESCHVHEKGVVKHEHAGVADKYTEKTDITGDASKKEKRSRKLPCPLCVVI